MDYEKYENHLEYPDRPQKPILGRNPTAAEAREYATKLEEYENGMPAYRAAQDAYGQETQRLQAMFFQDAAEELGYEKNTKRSKLEGIAWQMGHSSGLSEVYGHLQDLCELIK